jgi:hypothetical protein
MLVAADDCRELLENLKDLGNFVFKRLTYGQLKFDRSKSKFATPWNSEGSRTLLQSHLGNSKLREFKN